MQAVDNLTRISGRIVSRSPHPTLDAYELVQLALDRAEPIPGRANLLTSEVGKEIGVAIRRELLGAAKAGDQLRCRAKRTPDGALCEPHPEPGDFAIDPA